MSNGQVDTIPSLPVGLREDMPGDMGMFYSGVWQNHSQQYKLSWGLLLYFLFL